MKLATGTRVLIFLIVALAVIVGLRLLDSHIAPSMFDVIGVDALKPLTTPWFHLGPRSDAERTAPGLDVTPILMIQAVLFLVLISVLSRMVRRFLQTRILSHTTLDVGQQYALSNIFGYTLFVFALMIGLQTAGVDLSSLTLLGGALGVGIGFGLQAIVSNFVSGLIILIERPIKVGDRVEVGGTTGEVMRIGTRSTWVRSGDNAVIIVPNSEFVTGRVRNWTAVSHEARSSIAVTVGYATEPQIVHDLLLQVATSHPEVLRKPAPEVFLESLGDNGMRFQLCFWTSHGGPAGQRITSDLYLGALEVFGKQGIAIPHPQREIRMTTAPAPASPPPPAPSPG